MNSVQFKEETLYFVAEPKLFDKTLAVIQNAILQNNAVGFAAGYYAEGLPIAYVSEFFLHNLGYDYEGFMQASGGLLQNVFCGENTTYLQLDRFRAIQKAGEVQMRTRDGVPVNARAYKADSVDADGTPLWVISVRIDQTQQSLPKAGVKNLPIIAMTANAFAEDVMMAKNAGMNEHIAKPLDMTRLKEVLRRWL